MNTTRAKAGRLGGFLFKEIEAGDDFDAGGGAGRFEVLVHGRMERYCGRTGVLASLLSSGQTLRLVSFP